MIRSAYHHKNFLKRGREAKEFLYGGPQAQGDNVGNQNTVDLFRVLSFDI